MGSSKPKTQEVTSTPFFQNQSSLLANRVTHDALNRSTFQGDTNARLSDQQQGDISSLRNSALQGDPQFQAAQHLNQSTLQGDFLGPNPHLSAALAPIREEFQRTIAPSIDAAAVGAGRTGSGRHSQMQDTAQQSLADSMARVAYQNYGDERTRQQQALAAAPGLNDARFNDQRVAIGAGQMLQADRQAGLDDEARRFYEARQAPLAALGPISGVGGVQQSPYYQQSKASSAIGGGLAGAGIGAQVGGPFGAAIGGGLGAFGGLFG